MNKFLKCILSFAIAIGCISLVPTDAKNGKKNTAVLDRTGWTGIAFDGDSREEHGNAGGDGPVSNMLDSNTSSIFHTNYNSSNVATLPVYVFIDLGDFKTFGAFSWQNRGNNDAAKHYEFYVNETAEDLIPASDSAGYAGDLSKWTKVAASTENNYLLKSTTNLVDLDRKVYAKQIVIKVTETYEDKNANVEGKQTFVTCVDFNLYEAQQSRRAIQSLDRSKWSLASYNTFNEQEYETNHSSEGNPHYLIDGKTDTFWHTSYTNHYNSSKQSSDVPYYLIVDLDKDSSDLVEFKAYQWVNRGYQGNQGANGVVENYKLYYTTNNDLSVPLTGENGTIVDGENGWQDITTLIEGYKTADDSSTYAQFGYYTDSPSHQYATNVNLTEHVQAAKIMIEVKTTKNATSAKHASGVELFIYNDNLPTYIDLSNGKGTATVNCAAGIHAANDGARDDASVVINGNTDTYLSVEAKNAVNEDNPGDPIYVEIDMNKIYDIRQVEVDVYNDRTYNNVVIVGAETKEGFDNPNERYVIFNTDTNNVTGFGQDKEIDDAQSNYITAIASDIVTARYIRVYLNGSNQNYGNHIYEVYINGKENTDSNTVEDYKNTLIEGYYSDDTFTATSSTENEGYVTRYVNKNVLGVKAQVKYYEGSSNEDPGNYAFRFVSSVASLNPEKVGFEVQLNDGNVKTYESTKVFAQITENVEGATYTPDVREVFNNNASDYFFTLKINGIPTDATGTIKVRPYWIPNGSTVKVYGERVEYDVATLLGQ